MKVISQKVKDVQSMWPKRVFCDECQAELEIEESDVFVGEFGCYLFKCPCCGREVPIDGIERDTPPTFKQTFWHTYVSKSNDTKHIEDDEVQRMINHCVSKLISDDVEAGELCKVMVIQSCMRLSMKIVLRFWSRRIIMKTRLMKMIMA